MPFKILRRKSSAARSPCPNPDFGRDANLVGRGSTTFFPFLSDPYAPRGLDWATAVMHDRGHIRLRGSTAQSFTTSTAT